MKLRVPKGCGAVSHRGQQLEIAADGSIKVDDGDWVIFSTHGFRPWTEPPPASADFAAMTRDELVMQAMNTTLKTLKGIGTEDIRARLLAVEDAVLPFETENAPTSKAASDVDVETISTLNRHELFAFLRAKGVSVSLPITNEELRAMARRAFG